MECQDYLENKICKNRGIATQQEKPAQWEPMPRLIPHLPVN